MKRKSKPVKSKYYRPMKTIKLKVPMELYRKFEIDALVKESTNVAEAVITLIREHIIGKSTKSDTAVSMQSDGTLEENTKNNIGTDGL